MRAKAGPVARLIRGLDNTVLVEFGELAIFFERNDGDILLESPGDGDLAHIRLEAWDSPPPEPDTAWVPVENTTIEGGTGFVAVGSVAEDATERFVIGPPHFLYGLTAHSQPAGELPATGSEEELEQAYESREPERWLIRFWPIRDAFDPARHARPDHVDGLSTADADPQDFPPNAPPPTSQPQSPLPDLNPPTHQAPTRVPTTDVQVFPPHARTPAPDLPPLPRPQEAPAPGLPDHPPAQEARAPGLPDRPPAQRAPTPGVPDHPPAQRVSTPGVPDLPSAQGVSASDVSDFSPYASSSVAGGRDFSSDMWTPAVPARPAVPGGDAVPSAGLDGVERRPLPVEVPISEAADWPAARVAREQAVLEEQLAEQGATMADFLAAKGLPSDTPFDRMAKTVRQRSLGEMAEREGWPDWWRALARRYPDLGPQWRSNSHEAVDWPVERRHELARALVARIRTSAILNRDDARTFVTDIRVNKAEPGDTCRGWRWESAGAPDHETLTVNRRVVYEDVMSGTTLVTGIVTVLWRDEEGHHVRDAEPVEAARLICAEAVWATSTQGPADNSREWHAPSTTAHLPTTPHPPKSAQPPVEDGSPVTGQPSPTAQHPVTGQPPATAQHPITGQPSTTGERPSPHGPPPQAGTPSPQNSPPPAASAPPESSPQATGQRPVTGQSFAVGGRPVTERPSLPASFPQSDRQANVQ